MKDLQEIYIYGCGGVGNELAEYFINDPDYKLLGFIDDNPQIRECMGFESRTLDEMLKMKRPEEIRVIISIGEPAIRKSLSDKIAEIGCKEVSIDFSRHFNQEYSSIGTGTLLHEDSYISVNAHVGKCCLINKSVLVGHDCIVGDYSVLSPRVTLGGNVTVGEGTYIGTGAIIRNGITIGENAIIGMGAVVVKNVEDADVVAGNPAKFMRKNENRRVFKH